MFETKYVLYVIIAGLAFSAIDSRNELSYIDDLNDLESEKKILVQKNKSLSIERDDAVTKATDFEVKYNSNKAILKSYKHQIDSVLKPLTRATVKGLSNEDKLKAIRNTLINVDSLFADRSPRRSFR